MIGSLRGTLLERADDEVLVEDLAGVRFTRTRRPLARFRDRSSVLPVARVEPAALLVAGYDRSARTARRTSRALTVKRSTLPWPSAPSIRIAALR